jgi:hypothetical protein
LRVDRGYWLILALRLGAAAAVFVFALAATGEAGSEDGRYRMEGGRESENGGWRMEEIGRAAVRYGQIFFRITARR